MKKAFHLPNTSQLTESDISSHSLKQKAIQETKVEASFYSSSDSVNSSQTKKSFGPCKSILKLIIDFHLSLTSNLSTFWSKNLNSDVLSTKFSLNGDFVAFSLENGKIHLFSTTDSAQFTLESDTKSLPATCIVFRPNQLILTASCKFLIIRDACGKIIHWDYLKQKITSYFIEQENSINVVAYDSTGSLFATGGSDCFLRIYKADTNELLFKRFHGFVYINFSPLEPNPNIANRVFAIKFHPLNSNLVISGGWDNNLQLSDLQNGTKRAFGPHICGESLDFSSDGSKIIAGSHSKDNILQIWSTETMQIIKDMEWTTGKGYYCPINTAVFVEKSCFPEKAKIKESLIVAGGGAGDQSNNELRIFGLDTLQVVAKIHKINGSVNSIDFKKSLISVGLSNGDILLLRIDLTVDPELYKL